jgi:RNA polymerase sigma-70 factor (ECF subfamily)
MADEPGRDLLYRFVRGDEDAFEQVFRTFERDVVQWALRIVRDRTAAEDVAADAFWRAYRGRAQFDPARSFGAWLRRIVTNAAFDYLRRQPRERADLDAERLPAPPLGDDDTRAVVMRTFRRLPPRLQVVATLALIEELPYAEIADALDVPIGTVKSRVFRAVRLLRKELVRLGLQP